MGRTELGHADPGGSEMHGKVKKGYCTRLIQGAPDRVDDG